MKTKKNKGDAPDNTLTLDQIEQVAMQMAATAGTPTKAAEQEVAEMAASEPEAKPLKAARKKATKATAESVDAPVAETEQSRSGVPADAVASAEVATDAAVEAIADEVIVVEDAPLVQSEESAPVPATAQQPTADATPKAAGPNQVLFSDLDISNELLQAVTDMGFISPSPIQAEAIPPILAGRDVIGQAQTGTGKTAAFGIPALDLIDVQDRSVQVLVLCPTR